ncbi:hypothetical protein [Ensifer aridi]|uniref:hypothetical protein n=1 Tax=Ensifer aridi TaxID=1708715 RepID=UPI0015E28409|nr:hypothetical protein [Ensifer aridi]
MAKTSLERFGDMLHVPDRLATPVSLILVEPMLWARFEPSAGGVKTGVHVSGARRADLVLVSGEAVISEIAARRLTFGQAVERGLMRLYGSQSQITGFRRQFDQVGSDPADALEASDASPGSAASARFRFAKRLSCPASKNPTEHGCTPDRP